jgi:hypothetical protein
MSEPDNRKALSLPKHNPRLPNGHQARYTAETVLRTRPKTYRKIVHLLADPNWSVLQISKNCRVSEHTVRAIREREAQDIAERKKSLAAMLANVAELGAERMEQTIGKASLRDAVIATGVSVDKVALLTGPKMGLLVNIANIQPPTPEQDAEREATHAKLDEITRLLHEGSQSRENAR